MFFSPKPRRRKRPQFRISERRFLLRLGDVLATIIAVVIALIIWSAVDRRRPFDLALVLEQAYWFLVLPGLWLFLASVNDFYDLQLASDRTASAGRLVMITLQLFVVYLIIFFLSPRTALPRLFIFYYGFAAFFLIMLWRWWRPALMGWASERRQAAIVGTGWGADAIVQAIDEHAPGQYELVGLLCAEEGRPDTNSQLAWLGSGQHMLDTATERGIKELIVATPSDLTGELFQGVMDCYQHGISIVPMAILYERLTGRVPVEHVGNDWAIVLPIETASMFDPYPVIKRIVDVVLACVGLLMFMIMLPLIAAIIWIESPGPIFFGQIRVGQGGRLFRLVKLRSMVPDAERHTGAVFAIENDPRVTRVGRFLRKSRLDEVPQLWNVLRGEMSFIGPRPERPEFVDGLTADVPFYRARLAVKPGLTGWAQVRYHYVSKSEDHVVKLQYDLFYIRHHSVLLDMQILARTIGKVLTFSGT